MELSRGFLESSLGRVTILGRDLVRVTGDWCVDSRQVNPGDAFVALQGNAHDGHDFVREALQAGAQVVLGEERRKAELEQWIMPYRDRATVICVAQPSVALCALAAAWRLQFEYPVVGITGSVGKTTTKELTAAVLTAGNYVVLASEGNQNTMIGVSLNILRMRAEHTCAIFEMGVSRRGEMARLSELVRPTIAVITAIAHSHMEGLGALVDIAAEKREIFRHISNTGIGVVNGDQPLISGVAYGCPTIKFGMKTTNQVQARQVQKHGRGLSFILKLYGKRYPMVLATENMARVQNVLAAAAIGHFLKVADETIVRVLQQDVAVVGRFRKCMLREDRVLVDDSYNANPESMKAALLAFERMEAVGVKIGVLGEMRELGVNTPFWHRQLGRLLRKAPSIQHVIFVGEAVAWSVKTMPYGLSYEVVATWQEAVVRLRLRLAAVEGCAVLVKGSYGVGLHHLVEQMMVAP